MKRNFNKGQMSLNKNVRLAAPTLRKLLHIPEQVPRFAQISFTNYCNLSCKMCIRNYIDVEHRHMRWNDFKRVIDKLDGVEQISLAGMGESLTHPRFFDAVKYCKERGFRVQLTTNALLLGKSGMMEALIQSEMDNISFSIESVDNNHNMGHGNAEVVTNIERFIDLKRTLGSKTPKVILQPILFSDRVKDVYDIIKWGAEKGVDRINVVRVDLRFVPNMRRPSMSEEKQIFQEFKKLRKKYNIRVDCLQDQIFEGLKGFAYRHLKRLLRFDTWCYRFQDFIYVNVNGNVHPCCLSEEQIMGNLLEQGLDKIWSGRRFNYLRRNQNKFAYCRGCDFLSLKQVA